MCSFAFMYRILIGSCTNGLTVWGYDIFIFKKDKDQSTECHRYCSRPEIPI